MRFKALIELEGDELVTATLYLGEEFEESFTLDDPAGWMETALVEKHGTGRLMEPAEALRECTLEIQRRAEAHLELEEDLAWRAQEGGSR